MEDNFFSTDIYVPAEGGGFISERHARIGEILHDYDPTIDLAWIPADQRSPGDMPFAVMKTEENGARYIICFADENTCDERLLARVWSMDATKTNVLVDLELHNAAVEAVNLKKQADKFAEAHEFAETVFKSKLNNYKHAGVQYG